MKLDQIEINMILAMLDGTLDKWEASRDFWAGELEKCGYQADEDREMCEQHKKNAEYQINKLVACRDKLRKG